ncbi:DUF397 domain-containing protein [Saccharothrix australiensis]|uniref:Uncharacterized protein DUF397 n=1 Tax=Saccharothrix australiensis TaxID=2072 RepID=A0A495VUS5_9PSEU|nr:DUF397 domain-containing protein [Saccharothrix australiensis]RKT52223.1 uncharacterized protein DUF397 [Saccharothrix australiensis]
MGTLGPNRLGTVTWRKSSYSGGQGQCVEIAVDATRVAVRDSKNPDGPVLHTPRTAFAAFLRGLR